MAKKKTTQQAKDTNQQENTIVSPETHTETDAAKPTSAAMGDPAEKLKQLNTMLLKETTERRLQVESLGKEKEALEAELALSRSALEAELSRSAERMEAEKGVSDAFVAAQLEKMGAEVEEVKKERVFQVTGLEKKVSELVAEIESQGSVLSRLGLERDEVRSELDLWVREANGLKKRVIEMEKKEKIFEEELGNLRNEHQALIEEKNLKESALEASTREKDLFERNFAEKARLIENLERAIEKIEREKSEIEAEKHEHRAQIIELENNVENLNEIVSMLHKEEILLQGKVMEFEKKFADSVEKEKEMKMVINGLVKEKTEKEANIDVLLGEKSSLVQQSEAIKMESEDMVRRLEALSREKNDVEEVKASQECEIAHLRREASNHKVLLSDLQQTCRNQEEYSNQILSELKSYKDALENALRAKENLKKNFDEKCQTIAELNLEVAKLKKGVEENAEEFKQVKAKCGRLQEENGHIESHAASLALEKVSLEKKLSHAEQRIESLKRKVESACSNSEQALALLKNASLAVSQSKFNQNGIEDGSIGGGKLPAGIQPYLAELEVIKKAFSNKERLVDDLNVKLENLGNSVTEAHKKKSFWTMVSSATTVFAAISIAYAARGH